jgi:hypothetical protein
MPTDRESAETDLVAALQARGVTIAGNALTPLKRIDFTQLVAIHDHEEHFLRTVFVESLVNATRARSSEGGKPGVTAVDVRTAMLMLGAAAKAAPEQQFSASAKAILKEVCPYCANVPEKPVASRRRR